MRLCKLYGDPYSAQGQDSRQFCVVLVKANGGHQRY
jgi:hypothetical protein